VNAGIGGNQVVGPPTYSPQKPFPGGASAQARVEQDVIGLSGVTTVIWLEGINDFSKNGNASVEAVQAGMREVVSRLRAKVPGVRAIGATAKSRRYAPSSKADAERQPGRTPTGSGRCLT